MNKIGHKHAVVFLLFLFMVINFADKAVIGLAGPDIMKSLKLTPVQFGFVGSSFFFLFSLSGIAFGLLANRIDSHKLVLFLAFLWAILQFPLAATVSYGMLLACRIALGFGEGPAFPLALHTGYQWFENKDRNVPSTIIQQGANTGMMVAGPVLTYIIVYFSWHASFLFLGVIGLLWTGAWLVFGFAGRNRPPGRAREALAADDFSYRHTLLDPTFLSVLIVYFAEYAMVVILLTWLPAYLRLGLGFSKVETGWIFSMIVGLQIPVTIAVAKLSAVLLRRGVSSRLARGVVSSAGAVIGGGVLALLMTGISPVAKVACLAVGGVLTQLVFSFGPLIVGEICPEARRGGLFGIVSSIGTLAGIIAPVVMGSLIEADSAAPARGYEHGFLALGLMLALAGVFGILCMNPEKTRLTLSGRAERHALRVLRAN